MNFNIGDRVILKSGICYRQGYSLNSANPEQGSEYACEGTVTSSYPDVLWDNGKKNIYDNGDLEKVIIPILNLDSDFDDLLESI